ncbi:bacterio-opsin activator [Halobacteriales archaeon QS_5_70_17]|nr:MAG: bacterio-opsin activator [Halobacteriales archaeon QS_5_70_17]
MQRDARGASEDRTAQLEFRVLDRDWFFVVASDRAGCRIELEEVIHRADGDLLEFFTVEGASPKRVFELAEQWPTISDGHVVRTGETGGLLALQLSGRCIVSEVAEAGAVTRELSGEDGVGRLVAETLATTDVRTVVETVCEAAPETELLARREHDRPAPTFSGRAFEETLAARLTDRQREAVDVAVASGYFDWPRESSAADCAEVLGVSQPTFTQHLRAAEKKVFAALFGA